MRKGAMTAVFDAFTVIPLYKLRVSTAVLISVERTKAKQAIYIFRIVTGIIFTPSVLKIRMTHIT